jgi:hypothetical protein
MLTQIRKYLNECVIFSLPLLINKSKHIYFETIIHTKKCHSFGPNLTDDKDFNK